MTPHDLRQLARNWDYKETFFSFVPVGIYSLVGANPQRFAISFSVGTGPTSDVYVSTVNSNANHQGYCVYKTTFVPQMVHLNYWDVGGLVQQAWYCNCFGTGTAITVFESILVDR